MAENFFDLVKDGFFNPFTGSERRLNYDLLMLINSKMSLEKMQAGREDIIFWMMDYLENCPVNLFDENGQTINENCREYANLKLRYFVKYGWLIEDYESVRVIYQMDDNGIKILEAMRAAVMDDTKSMEFSGFVYAIYSHLKNFDVSHAVDIVEQIGHSSAELTKMLRGLNTNIKKFLTKLLRENEAKPKEILNTLLLEYQEKVVLKSFNNFRLKDNPSRYKQTINDLIDGLLEEEKLAELVKNYIEVKCSGIRNDKNIKEAEEFFMDRLQGVAHQFEEIGEYIEILNAKNAKYLATAKSRLNFLLNEERDMEGRIIECLKEIAQVDDGFFEDGYFGLFSIENIDENSLYSPKIKRTYIQTVSLTDKPTGNVQEINRLVKKLFENDEYSIKKINSFIAELLGERKRIYASELNVDCFEKLLKLFLAQIYAENQDCRFLIQPLNEKTHIFGYKTNDFIIERR